MKNDRTVKFLKQELEKFPDDAKIHAYEGEVTGIIITAEGYKHQGVIFTSEIDEDLPETEILKK